LQGTNNLGSSRPEEIFEKLKGIHEVIRSEKAISIAVTIPEHAQEPNHKHLLETREQTNHLLKTYCTEKQIAVVDLAEKLPYYTNTTEEHRLKYWDDHLHFSPAGYDRFGELVFEILKPQIMGLALE
jgi:lysophospholipase L1-like esterase